MHSYDMASWKRAAFTDLFDRVVCACAHAQRLATESKDAATRASAIRASSRRLRGLAEETRDAWREADSHFTEMRSEVEHVARAMRAQGVQPDEARRAVRTHIRFVLYDGGLTERVAEPVVERVCAWIDEIYHDAA